MQRLQIEAVTVSVGYGDLLREVAQFNRPLLYRWVVVTSPEDELTQKVCRDCSIECVVSAETKRDGPFSKGRLVNTALGHIQGNEWVLHLDGDTALPHDLHELLNDAHLDPRCLYGCDRFNVIGETDWEAVKRHGLYCRRPEWMVQMCREHCVVGSRVANHGFGYTPIGFFQLWHGSQRCNYPIHHGSAARTDVQFALHWSRQQRLHLPELMVWHIDSEKVPKGTNWKGRKTRLWGEAGESEQPLAWAIEEPDHRY